MADTAPPFPYAGEDVRTLVSAPGEVGDLTPADDEYAAGLRGRVQSLVGLDVRFGGDHTSVLALRALAAVDRDLERRGIRRRAGRDVRAAVAELAEVTGWLLCDANRQGPSYRVNRRALELARTAGDSSMELFVVHNMSLQATYLRRPRTTLALAAPVLDRGGLTPRLEAMFRLRVARAYAQMGLRTEATRTLAHATGLLSEGVHDRDPGWAWWVSERGFTHAAGAMLGGLGDWKAAIDPIQRALAAAPPEAHRERFLYLCVLMHAQLEAGAWRDAEPTAREIVPLLRTVRSGRPLARLSATLDRFHRDGRPPRAARGIVGDLRHAMGGGQADHRPPPSPGCGGTGRRRGPGF
ncbi:hypothetical protein AGRA3207_002059 [Actinomadura graeca]|uniref:Transcriptional regulator n=1 Tax=Actinomadura graeca TaxID=2750812 RepID=A0ABX8QRD6_9ACTN|nr:hypothetical protein [Actinomadura graeca]QXJ21225.1 hypothetical protein AGRA3207_002059 [Actinomadura graeca]